MFCGRATTAPREGGPRWVFKGFSFRLRGPVKNSGAPSNSVGPQPTCHMHIGEVWILPTVDHPLHHRRWGALGLHAVPRGGTQYCRYCRARCTRMWRAPLGMAGRVPFGRTLLVRSMALPHGPLPWTAPGWTDQSFIIGYVDRFCCGHRYSRCYVDRNWYWNDVGDTFRLY